MRIAITSRLFFPLMGGVPVIVRLLANAWSQAGHEVRLLTRTAAGAGPAPELGCEIIRLPTTADLVAAALWCDVVVQMEVSMRMIWPFMLARRPCFISHQTHFSEGRPPGLARRIQGWLAYCGHPVSCSQIIRQSWGGHGTVIGNPYDDSVFHGPAPEQERKGELLFVGRLVSDKGLDVLLRALVLLQRQEVRPRLTVIGDGLDGGESLVPRWREMAESLGLASQVTFLGGMDAGRIAEEMRNHRILVVPSTWKEPFGIVALEGLACGCRVVASQGGGLPEAGGPFACYFENGSAEHLAQTLQPLVDEPSPRLRDPALEAFLSRQKAGAVAARFVSHFESVLGRPAKAPQPRVIQ